MLLINAYCIRSFRWDHAREKKDLEKNYFCNIFLLQLMNYMDFHYEYIDEKFIGSFADDDVVFAIFYK